MRISRRTFFKPFLPVFSVIHAGERYDFVLRADKPPGSYYMKFRGQIDCNMTKTFQLAVLNYEDLPPGTMPAHTISRWDDAGPAYPGLQLNPVNVGSGEDPEQYVTVSELSSLVDDDPEIIEQEIADHQFYLPFDFNPVPNVQFFGKPRPNKSRRRLLHEILGVSHFLPQLSDLSFLCECSHV